MILPNVLQLFCYGRFLIAILIILSKKRSVSLALPPSKHWYFNDSYSPYVDDITTSTLGKILIHIIFLLPLLFMPVSCSLAVIKQTMVNSLVLSSAVTF